MFRVEVCPELKQVTLSNISEHLMDLICCNFHPPVKTI